MNLDGDDKLGNKGQNESVIGQLLTQNSRAKRQYITYLDLNFVIKLFELQCNDSKWDMILLGANTKLAKAHNPNSRSDQDLYHYLKYCY